ncbi:hypothetical protein NC651_036620 [Populus alba x Populus x berolinensis]|nr:hypothetical protein NC651_036620 [Populus alba x Populus x berolinensis]
MSTSHPVLSVTRLSNRSVLMKFLAEMLLNFGVHLTGFSPLQLWLLWIPLEKEGLYLLSSVDLSQFTQVDEVGYGYGDSPALCSFESPNSSSSAYKKDTLKIGVLQPSEEF